MNFNNQLNSQVIQSTIMNQQNYVAAMSTNNTQDIDENRAIQILTLNRCRTLQEYEEYRRKLVMYILLFIFIFILLPIIIVVLLLQK